MLELRGESRALLQSGLRSLPKQCQNPNKVLLGFRGVFLAQGKSRAGICLLLRDESDVLHEICRVEEGRCPMRYRRRKSGGLAALRL